MLTAYMHGLFAHVYGAAMEKSYVSLSKAQTLNAVQQHRTAGMHSLSAGVCNPRQLPQAVDKPRT
jgi:hypothetical protein